MISKENRLIITFRCTTDAIAMEKACKETLTPGRLIPVPRSISASCGLSWCADPSARPALEALQEIQRTGDIFFPRDWVRALLSGHTSSAARKEVDDFFAAHPDYPVLLSNKIRQQADHLYR